MTGFITLCSGQGRELPELFSWDLTHGFCSPCDCFEVSFLYSPEMLAPLAEAVRFKAVHEDETVFFGVVDELELSADAAGCAAVLRGRGMQALLLDNEAESADYTGAAADFILERHAVPWGVADADCTGLERVRASLSVSAGESCWGVIDKFAQFCAGVRPRFSPGGRLILDGERGGRERRITAATPISAQSFVQDRYGVISSALVKNRVLGSQTVVDNAQFQALGGRCRRIVNVPRRTGFDAMRHTGTYQIRRSAEGMRTMTLALPELFAAFPGDRAELRDTPLGVDGRYLVWQSRCWADGQGAGTVLTLRPEGAAG